MNYADFREKIVSELRKIVEDNIDVSLHPNVKNNGITRWSVTMKKQEDMCTPTIYLESFYEEYAEGKNDIYQIACEIKKAYFMYYDMNLPKFDIESFRLQKNIDEKIFCKVINKEKNEELLKKVPHKEFLDLAVVYYYMFLENEDGNHTTLINNKYMDMWKMDEDELYNIAVKNTLQKQGICFKNIKEIVGDICGDNVNKMEDEINEYILKESQVMNDTITPDMYRDILDKLDKCENEAMYVLTNNKTLFGATTMLFKQVLKVIANRLDSNIYILPSSIHEIILVPNSYVENEEELKVIVRDVNQNVVSVEDVLSDNVYYYDKEKDTIEIV